MLPALRVSGRFPVQEPLTRAEIEERELWGPEDRFGHARVADGFDVSAILVQLHAIRGESHGLVFHASACPRTPIHSPAGTPVLAHHTGANRESGYIHAGPGGACSAWRRECG